MSLILISARNESSSFAWKKHAGVTIWFLTCIHDKRLESRDDWVDSTAALRQVWAHAIGYADCQWVLAVWLRIGRAGRIGERNKDMCCLYVIDLRGSLIRRIRTSNPFPACRCVPAKLRCRESKATSSTPMTDFLVSIQCSPFVSSNLPLPASNPPQPRVFCRTPQVPGESAAVQLLLTRIPCQWNAHPMA